MRFLTGLRAFHYTAQLGGTTAAAAKMGVSQPTVSAHIGELERQFGVELFMQVGRRLQPTDFSETLLLVTDRLFDLEDEAHSMLTDAHGLRSGHLRVAAVGPYNVMPLLAQFRRWYPGIHISLSVGDSQQIVEKILSYQADVGVLVHSVDDERVECIPFRRQRLRVFAHHAHPLAARDRLSVKDLAGHDLVCREAGSTTQDVFDAALASAGVHMNRVMEIGSRESVREAVACGVGLGVVSEIAYVHDPRLRLLAIDDLQAFTHSHVICLRERLRSRLMNAFMHLLEDFRH
ncbi:MAG TPA: LysR substrate-binding domain-containing protein, partial [Steroidobacteraceae bacterium]|nr:LysR substrate-binding domain-containing protein [Steroidobacteraceae bacterium]